MKFVVLLSVLVAVTVAYDFPEENEHFDIPALVKDKEALRRMNDCFLGKTECDRIAKRFKDALPHAVQTACTACNDNQRVMLRQYLRGLYSTLRAEYFALEAMYDPHGQYFKKLWNSLMD